MESFEERNMTDAKIRTYARSAGETIAPTVIETDNVGLVDAMIEIHAVDRAIPGYFARPETGANWPIILVLSEAFGLHEHIMDVARRLAKEGYIAIAPDLMVRQGDPLSFDNVGKLVSDLLLHIPDAQVMSDLDATLDWAKAEGGDASRIGATGFCWGGRWIWLYAAHRPLNAAVAWYGVLDGHGSPIFPDEPDLFPAHPIDVAAKLQGPVLGLYGAEDNAIPVPTVHNMRAALERARDPSRIDVFDGAGHAFFADYRDSYVPLAATEGWRRMRDWFSQHMDVQR
ncbi:MAG: dienelactone hydrolase family protein [Tabrizicola sp.]|nr:dienelactone hydrolase family protein [Tabrizicola sp.]